NDPLNRLQRLLGIAAGHILMHSVEDLLDVYPDIARANRIRLATFAIFGAAAADLLVIAPQNLRDVGIFCGDIEAGLATSIIEQLLADPHPVDLGAVAALIAQRYPVTRPPIRPGPHRAHEFRKRVEVIADVGAQ